jgi:hypothetical protein
MGSFDARTGGVEELCPMALSASKILLLTFICGKSPNAKSISVCEVNGDSGERMRGISSKVFIALAVSVAMVTVCALPAEAAWSYNFGTKKIPAGQYFEIKAFTAQEDAGMSCNVTKFYGPNFDVLLMDKANFDIYKSGSNAFFYLPASALDFSYVYTDTGIGGLTTGTEYHLVIDNTNRPVGGANPEGAEVQVFFEFGAANVQTLTDMGLIIILLIVVVVAVVAIVVLFLFMRSGGKRKAPQQQMQYGQPLQQSGIKACPRCGAQLPAEYTFCPQCGNRN